MSTTKDATCAPSSLFLLGTAVDSYLGIAPQAKKKKVCIRFLESLFMSDGVNSIIKKICISAYVGV